MAAVLQGDDGVQLLDHQDAELHAELCCHDNSIWIHIQWKTAGHPTFTTFDGMQLDLNAIGGPRFRSFRAQHTIEPLIFHGHYENGVFRCQSQNLQQQLSFDVDITYFEQLASRRWRFFDWLGDDNLFCIMQLATLQSALNFTSTCNRMRQHRTNVFRLVSSGALLVRQVQTYPHFLNVDMRPLVARELDRRLGDTTCEQRVLTTPCDARFDQMDFGETHMIYGFRVPYYELHGWLTIGYRIYLYKPYDPKASSPLPPVGFKQLIREKPLPCVIDGEHVAAANGVHYFETNTIEEYRNNEVFFGDGEPGLRFQTVRKNLFNFHLQSLAPLNYGHPEELFEAVEDGAHVVIGVSLFRREGSSFFIESQCGHDFFPPSKDSTPLHENFIADLIGLSYESPLLPHIHSHFAECFNEFLVRSPMIDAKRNYDAQYYAVAAADEAELAIDEED